MIRVRMFWYLRGFALLLLFLTFFHKDANSTSPMFSNSTSGSLKETTQLLSIERRREFQEFIESGHLSDLRWPDFEDYRTDLTKFYEPSGFTLAWIRESKVTIQARSLVKILQSADNKGLHSEDYDGSRWTERLTKLSESGPSLSESDLIRFDLALTVSVMRYISDLHVGRINPRQFHFGLRIRHENIGLAEFLRQRIVESQNVTPALDEVEPPFPAYHRTLDALNKYLKLVKEDEGELLPEPRRTLKPGDPYTGVPRLARLLNILGDLSDKAEVFQVGKIYQGHLIDGVNHFKIRHGLNPDGKMDLHTFHELNVPLSRRVLQLQLTLERWRWLPHDFAEPPIVVNIPEFRLHADNADYHWVLSMKVVVGKAYGHKTPIFASEVESIIFRPYWDVPASITRAELLPEIEKDPGKFAAKGYEFANSRGEAISAGEVNEEILRQLKSGTLAVRQKPGSNNALGLVKFVIPSNYDVYLHGTPATELFSRSRRDFSHGCIRVKDPVALAVWALRDKPEWTEERIRAAMNGEKTVQVKLEKPIPVLILYSTAVVMENGEVRFFDDIYGHDASLEHALAKGYPYPR